MGVESGSHRFREIVHFLHLCGGTSTNLTLAQGQFRVQQTGRYQRAEEVQGPSVAKPLPAFCVSSRFFCSIAAAHPSPATTRQPA